MKMKKCSKCKRLLPANPQYFYRKARAKDGLSSQCKECRAEYYRIKHKMKRYGINKETLEQMIADQNKICPICGKTLNLDDRLDINIDHDHSNGKIREVLCINCNIMIGNAKENPLILIKAIHYLRKHKSKPILKAKHKAKRNKINKLIFVNPFIDLTHFLKNDKKDEEDRIILISSSSNKNPDKIEEDDNE